MRSGGPAVLSLLLPLLAAPIAPAALADPAPTAPSSTAAFVARAVPPVPSIVPPAPAPPLSPRRAAHLAKDASIRAAYARSELPASARIEVVGDVFVVAAGDASAPFDAAVDLTRRTVAALYAGPFAHRPDQAVNVYVYGTKAAFDRGAERFALVGHTDEDLLGLYDPFHRAIVVRTDAAGIGSLNHEIVHPLIADALPHAHAWLHEGVPALFEVADVTPTGEMHFGAHFRLQTLRDALASKKPGVSGAVSLEALFAMRTDEDFLKEPQHVHYALAREALRWLHSQGKLWTFLDTYAEHILDDPDGVDSFTRVVGKSPADANADFLAWIQSKASEKPT